MPSAGADSSAVVPDGSPSATTVTVLIVSSVVVLMIVSDPDGVTSLDEPFSVVVSPLVDGTTTVDSVTLVTCVTVVPLTASELALRLFEFCL